MFRRRDVLLSALAAPLMGQLSEAQERSAFDFSWLDERLEDRVRAGFFDGMGLIIGRRKAVLHEAYFGNAKRQTVLHVASAGKWPAAATLAAVVDTGALSWSSRVRDVLPQFRDKKGEATLGQLLSHTSGFPDYQPADMRRDDYQSLEEAVSHIVGLPNDSNPGSQFHYGGLAMQVAGRMAEAVAGRSFNDLFVTKIAKPLAMRQSSFTPVSQEPGFSPMLAGAFFTTAPDYGRFLMMLAGDGRFGKTQILSPEAMAAMQGDWVRQARVKPMEFVDAARADLRIDIYGLGEWREEVDAQGRPTLLSSPGWAGAYGWLDKTYGVWGYVHAKANVAVTKKAGYNTFLGSTIYAPMTRAVLDAEQQPQWKSGRIDTAGARLYYEESGTGVPVILLHGHSLDRRMWGEQTAFLEKIYRVIRYDLRGYGRSSLPEEGKTFLHAEDLLRLMNRLKIGRAHLVGLSLGGSLTADMLALYPDRVLKAVMAEGDLFDTPGPDTPWTEGEVTIRRNEIAAIRAEGIFAFKRRWFDGLIKSAGSQGPAIRRSAWAMIDEWQAWQPLHIEPRCLLGRSLPAHLEGKKPRNEVLVVRRARQAHDLRIRALLPQARFEVIEDCGHLANMEQPQAFNRILGQFLAG